MAGEELIDLRDHARFIEGSRGDPLVAVLRDARRVHAPEVAGLVDVHRDDDDLGIEQIQHTLAGDGRDARQRQRRRERRGERLQGFEPCAGHRLVGWPPQVWTRCPNKAWNFCRGIEHKIASHQLKP